MNKTTAHKTVLSLVAAFLLLSLPAVAQDRVTLTLWHNHPEWKDRVTAILAKFEAQHPNIHIDLTGDAGASYVPRMNTALAAGEAPDIIAAQCRTRDTPPRRSAGYTADLTGQLDVSSLDARRRSARPRSTARCTACRSSATTPSALYYNRDIFARKRR